MANKRVSELNALTDPASADLLLVADVTAQESKKLTLSDLGTFILSGGALTASLQGTASYALNAKSSSHALNADNSIFAIDSTNAVYADTASYILQAVSASYSSTSSICDIAFSQTGGNISARTGSVDGYLYMGKQGDLIGGVTTYHGGGNDFGNIFMSGSGDQGRFCFRTLDNGTEPFVFETWVYPTMTDPIERFRIDSYTSHSQMTTLAYCHGIMSSSVFSSSKNNEVGFYGTASYAISGPGSGLLAGGSFDISASYASASTSASYALSSSHTDRSDLADYATVANVSNTVATVPVGINVMKTLAYTYFTSSAGDALTYNKGDPLLSFNVDSVTAIQNTSFDSGFVIMFTTPVETTNYYISGLHHTIGSNSTYGLMITQSSDRALNGCTASSWCTDANPHILQFTIYSL